jgi:hypothetical protein
LFVHTGKVPLIDEPAGFIYHLFTLESSVPVNKTERRTQRPKMAMAAVKKGLAIRLWLEALATRA